MNLLQRLSVVTDALRRGARSLVFWRKKKVASASDDIRTQVARQEQQAVLRLSGKRVPSPKQLKYAWRIFTKSEQRFVIGALIAAFVFLIAFAGTYSYNRTALLPTVGGIYTEGLLQAPQFLNPVLAFNNGTDVAMNRLLFSGLVKYDKDLNIVPDLAESYTMSEDETTYTFVLKENLFWHDGQPLTASDVVFTIQTIQDPQFNSPHFGRFRDVAVSQIDDRTITFTLPESFAGFLPYMTIGIIPQHIWEQVTPSASRLAEANVKPIGSGPYVFDKLQKETDGTVRSYTLKSFDKYHSHQSYIETINLRFYVDLTEAIDALQRQNIDALEFLPQGNRIELSQLKTIELHTFSLPQYTALFINQIQNDQLASRGVRTALAHAIDKQTIVSDVFADQAQVIDSPILPGTIGYFPDIQKYDFATETAQTLLTEAGWERNEETNLLTKDDEVLSITLTTVDVADTMIVAQRIKESWEALGIEVNLDIVPRQFIEQDVIAPRNYQVLLFGEVLGADQDQFPFWHSSKRQHPGVNLTGFADTKADSLLEEARKTANEEKRSGLYKEFQNILIENVPAIFLYTPQYTYPVHSRIKGIEQQRINTAADRYNDIHNWYIRTERQWASE
ncbi:MAG: ABC transporter substrate-binding protein [Patescibacteria group bacterium]